MTHYPEHGSFTLSINGNIFVAYLNGGWNIETAQTFCIQFKHTVAPLLNHSWGHLVFFNDWIAGVPGVKEELEPLVEWCIQNNLKRAAHVYPPSYFKKTYIQNIVKDKEAFVLNTFNNSKDAIQWLGEADLYLADPEIPKPL